AVQSEPWLAGVHAFCGFGGGGRGRLVETRWPVDDTCGERYILFRDPGAGQLLGHVVGRTLLGAAPAHRDGPVPDFADGSRHGRGNGEPGASHGIRMPVTLLNLYPVRRRVF